jgi:hypothetical protein
MRHAMTAYGGYANPTVNGDRDPGSRSTHDEGRIAESRIPIMYPRECAFIHTCKYFIFNFGCLHPVACIRSSDKSLILSQPLKIKVKK